MSITLRCERTASGGRTVVIILPAAARPSSGTSTLRSSQVGFGALRA